MYPGMLLNIQVVCYLLFNSTLFPGFNHLHLCLKDWEDIRLMQCCSVLILEWFDNKRGLIFQCI